MRRVLVVLGSLLVALSLTVPARAAFDDARAWFDSLSPDDRRNTQAELVVLGEDALPIDGRFGHSLYDALTTFQRALGEPPTGALSERARQALADEALTKIGPLAFEPVEDAPAGLRLDIPARFFTQRTATGSGTSYSTADGEFSLETMRAELDGGNLTALYAAVISPGDGRVIEASALSDDRFFVTGRLGDYQFSTQFVQSGAMATGYSMAWGRAYETEGRITAAWLSAHVTPEDVLSPDPMTTAAIPDALPAEIFSLPLEAPDVILLSGDITPEIATQFAQILSLRPKARVLALNSAGGDVEGALDLARAVRQLGLATAVPDGMGCYSACAYVFFAGTERDAAGELGVQQISTDSNDLVFAQSILGDLLDVLKGFGVEQPVISVMLRTPPEDMYVFSPEEVETLNINAGSPIALALVPPEPGSGAALIELSSLKSASAAEQSLEYALSRWGRFLEGAPPRIDAEADLFHIRVPVQSYGAATRICAAIQEAGGGCFVRPVQ